MALRKERFLLALFFPLWACTSAPDLRLDTKNHIQARPDLSGVPQPEIPRPVQRSFIPPPQGNRPKTETYSVVVDRVPVHELLFALARDAKINIDIHPGITGKVSLNALNQTLPQLLSRIARQVDMRFEMDGPNLVVLPDAPLLRTYRVDYVNMSRDVKNSMSISSAVGSWISDAGSKSPLPPNGSTNSLDSVTKNHFYETFVQNLKDILKETDKQIPSMYCQDETAEHPAASSAPSIHTSVHPLKKCVEIKEAATIISNPETGVITVRATARQHEKVQDFINSVLSRVKRQVLIEVTVTEVQLSQNYQQGIDWSVLNLFDTGLSIVQKATGSISGPSATMAEIGYTSGGNNFSGTIKLLDTFGTVKVLSSPKLSVLNNQTAVMKVVDDSTYFTYEIKETDATTNAPSKTTITSTLHTVPVGLVLSLTPQIGDDDSVTLNIRPSISRVIGQKDDPSLDLFKTSSTIRNSIPIIRSREFDSVMRVANGNIAVMGGLMEDLLQNNDNAVPGVSSTPLLGGLFQNRDDTRRKTELVIFVRPTIIRDASLKGDYSHFRKQLPEEQFFNNTLGPRLPDWTEARK